MGTKYTPNRTWLDNINIFVVNNAWKRQIFGFLGVSTKGKRGIGRKTGEFAEKEQSFNQYQSKNCVNIYKSSKMVASRLHEHLSKYN